MKDKSRLVENSSMIKVEEVFPKRTRIGTHEPHKIVCPRNKPLSNHIRDFLWKRRELFGLDPNKFMTYKQMADFTNQKYGTCLKETNRLLCSKCGKLHDDLRRMMHDLAHNKIKGWIKPRCLILKPTREMKQFLRESGII